MNTKFQFFIELHLERLNYWTVQYEKEKEVLLHQYQTEMETYKKRKFKAHKELECVHHALESQNEAQQKLSDEIQLEKVDKIKSQVSNNSKTVLTFFFVLNVEIFGFLDDSKVANDIKTT